MAKWRITLAATAAQRIGMVNLPIFICDANAALTRVPDVGEQNGRRARLHTHPDLRRMERVRGFAKSDFIGD